MFRQNEAIVREQLCSFLSHFNVNMVGDVIGRNDDEVAQKGTQLLPEDGIVLPKHVAAIVKKKKNKQV
jgi:hypothetical protein